MLVTTVSPPKTDESIVQLGQSFLIFQTNFNARISSLVAIKTKVVVKLPTKSQRCHCRMKYLAFLTRRDKLLGFFAAVCIKLSVPFLCSSVHAQRSVNFLYETCSSCVQLNNGLSVLETFSVASRRLVWKIASHGRNFYCHAPANT